MIHLTLSEHLNWLPSGTAPADQLNAAYAHALANAVPLINGSWNARSSSGRVPALLLNLDTRPDVRDWLARTTRQTDTAGMAEIYVLDAPADTLALLVVQADALPLSMCANLMKLYM